MIGYFPTIYPDELLYSQLARYCAKSGYIGYVNAAEDLFVNKWVRPDIEFVNQYTPAALQVTTREIPMQEIVLKHTMFPFYGRFLPPERRKKAFSSLAAMEGNYHNLLAMPARKEKRFLRYCPLCVMDDREKYGETYWHRSHQMQDVRICPKHSVMLHKSGVAISGSSSPTLEPAESNCNNLNVIKAQNELECQIAKYIADAVNTDVAFDSSTIGKYLHFRLVGTKYTSVRGKQRNISLLFNDYYYFYAEIWNLPIKELWQLQKIFTDNRYNFIEICMVAYFLHIPVSDLTSMMVVDALAADKFDDKVIQLHEQGLKYPEIAQRLNASYNLVKPIGEGRYIKQKKPTKSQKGGTKKKDWQQIDHDTLPLVKQAIKQLYGTSENRPKKITTTAVSKLLYLPDKQIENLPLCRREINKYAETQEEYWAREIVWAANKIVNEEKTWHWTTLRRLTNMTRQDFRTCFRHIANYTTPEMVAKIKLLL